MDQCRYVSYLTETINMHFLQSHTKALTHHVLSLTFILQRNTQVWSGGQITTIKHTRWLWQSRQETYLSNYKRNRCVCATQLCLCVVSGPLISDVTVNTRRCLDLILTCSIINLCVPVIVCGELYISLCPCYIHPFCVQFMGHYSQMLQIIHKVVFSCSVYSTGCCC